MKKGRLLSLPNLQAKCRIPCQTETSMALAALKLNAALSSHIFRHFVRRKGIRRVWREKLFQPWGAAWKAGLGDKASSQIGSEGKGVWKGGVQKNWGREDGASSSCSLLYVTSPRECVTGQTYEEWPREVSTAQAIPTQLEPGTQLHSNYYFSFSPHICVLLMKTSFLYYVIADLSLNNTSTEPVTF